MPRKTLTIAAASVAAGLLAAVGADLAAGLYADRLARAEIDAFVAAHPGLRIGGVKVEDGGGRVTLRDVAAGSGPWQVTARSVSVPVGKPRLHLVAAAFAQAPGATAAPPPGTASAADVTLVRGATTYTIKKIDLTGTSLSNADLVALLAPGGSEPLAARLRKFKADTVTLTDVASLTKAASSETRASLTQVVLSHVADGKVGAASVAAGTASVSGEQGTSIKTGTIQATGLDIAAMERMTGATRKDDSEPLKTLADTVTINDVAVVNADRKTTVTVGLLTEKGLKARPFKTDITKLSEGGTGDPATDRAIRSERTKAFLDDLGTSVELASFRMDRVTLSNVDSDKTGRLAIASIGVDDYHLRSLGAATVRDFGFEGPGARLGFATLDVKALVFPEAVASDDAEALTSDAYPSVGRAELTDIVVDAAPVQEDGSTSKIKFKIAHVASSGERQADRFPAHGEISFDHITFDVPDSEAAGAQEFLAMGYRQVDLSSALTTTFDRKRQTLSVDKFLLSGVDMGSATLAVELGNVSQNILSQKPTVARASALAMLLKRVDLRLANAGLVEKGLALKAQQDGKSVAEERKAAVELCAVTLPQILGNGAGIKAIGTAAASFISDPKTLHVSLASKDGLGASDIGLIGSPDDLLSRLDIAAEANR